MGTGLRRMFRGRRRITLVAMREAEMAVVHPDMDTSHQCGRCGVTVGLFPSGQRVLRKYGRVDIVCQNCMTADEREEATPAPGMEAEVLEAQPR
jgi:hypothetical protein